MDAEVTLRRLPLILRTPPVGTVGVRRLLRPLQSATTGVTASRRPLRHSLPQAKRIQSHAMATRTQRTLGLGGTPADPTLLR
jgi:hypothetical protein